MVDVSEVVVGSCFVTANEQVRRVTEITVDGLVGYEARGKSFKLGEKAWHIGGPTKSNWPDKATFAAQVVRKVRCDWDPDFE